MLTTAPLGLLLLAGFCLGQHFGYNDDDGPSTWGKNFPTCMGKCQSPINIDESSVQDIKLPPLELCGKLKTHRMTITNNGHTIMLKSAESDDNLPRVTGGPLKDKSYRFEQLHFHWGRNISEGSETTINDKPSPMEMHAVFFNEDYGSMAEALQHKDGLTVLGYFYDVKKAPRIGSKIFKPIGRNRIFDPIVKALPEIQEPNEEGKKIDKFQLSDLLNPDDSNYFIYNGSLTTPPCSEVVTWVVFGTPKHLSTEQLNEFRKLKNDKGEDLTHNFRPVQPLEGRVVYRNIPSRQRSGQCSKKLPLPWMAIETLLGLFLYTV